MSANNNVAAENAPATTSAQPDATAAAAATTTTAASAEQQAQAQSQNHTTASLYVGELDPSVTEAMLFELFNMVGPVASIRVCRDAVTRRSLGYAYVNYHNADDCERSLETLNYTPIRGKPCRIMWSQRDPSLRKTGAGNIFIKNLDPTIDNKMLHDTFSAFGKILSCKVALETAGVSRGYGFVHYETPEAAEKAIKAVNGMLLNDRKVFVGLHVSRKERQSKIEEARSKFTNVYVKNLDASVDTDMLYDLFNQYGNVTSAVVSTDPETGASKGFGFINFEDHEGAQRAVEEMHEKEINEKKLYVARAQKKSEREDELRRQFEHAKMEKLNKYQGVNLYVKNLEDTVDDEQLRQEFTDYGVITSAKVMRDEKGISKGFGFVCFSSPDEATKAVTEMNGHMIGIKPIYVALAQRKEVRRSQLEAQMAQRNQLRMQQAATQGMPGAMYPGAPVYYPAGPGFPAGRGNMVYPQNGMVPRPRWAAGGQQPGAPINNQYSGVPQGGYPGAPMGRGGRPMRGRGGVQSQQGRPGVGAAGGPGNQRTGPGGARGGAAYKGNAVGRGAAATNAPAAGDNAAPAAAAAPANSSGLTAAALAAAPPEQQKQMLGEALFPLIAEHQPELAGKITGMLLEMDNGELLHLLESPEARIGKIDEAIVVLKQHSIAPEKSEAAAV